MAGVVVALLTSAGPAIAQLPQIGEHVPARIGVGYAANAPSSLLGGSVWGTAPVLGGLGLYVDAKFDASSPGGDPDFVADLTAQEVDEQFGDRFVKDEDSWWSVNVALMRPLTRQLTVYVGGGMADRTAYRRYYDLDRELGTLGAYWVENPVASQQKVNFMAGAIFTLTGHLNFQFGGETAPGGVTVGLSMSFPKLDLPGRS